MQPVTDGRLGSEGLNRPVTLSRVLFAVTRALGALGAVSCLPR